MNRTEPHTEPPELPAADTAPRADAAAAAGDAAVRIGPGSHVTLHYRISLEPVGADVISTFGDRPATLTLGLGQLAEPLEQCLLGLAEGQHAVFELPAQRAFGPRNPALLQRLSRAVIAAHSEPGADFAPGDLLEFPAPGGGRYAGVLKEIDARGALLDFNHPLAGQPVRFEVRILGVL
jgi:FKBP-type peptidyl-prolyl cis-trans isomerase SlpA